VVGYRIVAGKFAYYNKISCVSLLRTSWLVILASSKSQEEATAKAIIILVILLDMRIISGRP
jgi:hypothetical protein